MGIAKVRRWQWMVISLVVGYGLATVQQLGGNVGLTGYPQGMSDQRQFETGLVTLYEGIPHFRDIVVYPEEIDVGRGPKKLVHVVVGYYYDARRNPKGSERAVWHPRAFVADVPYQPVEDWGKPVNRGLTVLDHLERLHRQRGLSYRYAWWRAPRWRTAVACGGSFLVLGLIWPTIINLLAFGSFFRPAEEKGPSLREAFVAAAAPPPAVARSPHGDMEKVEAMAARLESQLASGAVGPASPIASEPAKQEPVKPLTATETEVQGVAPEKEHKAFGAGADDFYPTERKGKQV